MKTLTLYVVSVALLGFATLGLAEIVTWGPCSDDNSSCLVHEVKIQPCREATTRNPCRIKKARSASISFDFTPDFSGNALKTRAYWMTKLVNIPFIGMNSNACDSTPCPATAGRRQTYNYTLPIASYYPNGMYDVMWKMWNAENKECCFTMQIKLVN